MNWILVCLCNLLLINSCLTANNTDQQLFIGDISYPPTGLSEIEQICATSTHIEIAEIEGDTFANFTKPYPNVKELTLGIRTDKIGSDLPFDVIFPNLESLRINYWSFSKNESNNATRFIESEFPTMANLKSLFISTLIEKEEDFAIVQAQLGNLLQKNAQINKLYCNGFVMNNFIHQINEYLPNLQNFSVYNLHPKMLPVHFENVKHFEVLAWDQCPAENISFSHLETLKMAYVPRGRDSWVKFFANHENLTQLDCKATGEDGLVEMLANLTQLNAINISSWENFHINFTIHLIESHDNLVKFHYDSKPRNESVLLDMHSFVEQFKNEWNITYKIAESRPFIDLEKIVEKNDLATFFKGIGDFFGSFFNKS